MSTPDQEHAQQQIKRISQLELELCAQRAIAAVTADECGRLNREVRRLRKKRELLGAFLRRRRRA